MPSSVLATPEQLGRLQTLLKRAQYEIVLGDGTPGFIMNGVAYMFEGLESAMASFLTSRIETDLQKVAPHEVLDSESIPEPGKPVPPETIQAVVAGFAKAIGAKSGECSKCGRGLWWCVTRNGKKQPIDAELGISHFANCTHAQDFRKRQAADDG